MIYASTWERCWGWNSGNSTNRDTNQSERMHFIWDQLHLSKRNHGRYKMVALFFQLTRVLGVPWSSRNRPTTTRIAFLLPRSSLPAPSNSIKIPHLVRFARSRLGPKIHNRHYGGFRHTPTACHDNPSNYCSTPMYPTRVETGTYPCPEKMAKRFVPKYGKQWINSGLLETAIMFANPPFCCRFVYLFCETPTCARSTTCCSELHRGVKTYDIVRNSLSQLV